jgi:hypothetical protein
LENAEAKKFTKIFTRKDIFFFPPEKHPLGRTERKYFMGLRSVKIVNGKNEDKLRSALKNRCQMFKRLNVYKIVTRECLVDKPRSFLSVGGIYVQVLFPSTDREK